MTINPVPTPPPVTTDEQGGPTLQPQPKVLAATGGAAVGGAISAVGIWAVETTAHIDIPTAIEGSILVLVVAACTFVAGWLKRPSGIN